MRVDPLHVSIAVIHQTSGSGARKRGSAPRDAPIVRLSTDRADVDPSGYLASLTGTSGTASDVAEVVTSMGKEAKSSRALGLHYHCCSCRISTYLIT